jgi:replication factor A1
MKENGGIKMTENEDIAPHVEDIARVLKDEVNREELEKELRHYLTEYRIPLGTAKQMLVKKYGGTPSELGLGVSKTVEQLAPNEASVDLLARVVSVNFKVIDVGGEKKRIAFGLLGDQTATVSFTMWNTDDWKFQKGDVVAVHNAYTKEWKGKPQLNFGDRTQIELKSKDALPNFVTRASSEPANCQVRDLKGGVSNVSLTARVLFVEARTVNVSGEQKQVFSGLLADETGKVQFSSWHDFDLKEGDVIRIAGGYVKTWRGIPQFNFDERAEVAKLDTGDMPSLEELAKRRVYLINELAERGGAVDAAVEGVIIDIRTGSGLIFRCPECNRVVQKGVCRLHGEVEGKADLRIKAVLDDGTGALTAVLGRGITETLLGRDIEECQKIAREAMDGTVISDELRDLLVATPVRIAGDATMDEFGIMLISKDAEFIKTDVVSEARALLEELEG